MSSNSGVATAISIISGTETPDATYLIGDPAMYLPVPQYDKFPSYVDVQFTYQVVTPVPFAEIYIDPILGPKVQLQTTNPLDFGYYTLELLTLEEFSGLTHTSFFNVQVTCVRSITPTTTVPDFTYYVYDPAAVATLPIIQLNPLLCPNELVYTLVNQDSSPVQATFTLDTTVGSEKVSVSETDPMLTGVYPLKVILTDPTTSVTGEILFKVTILCTKSISLVFNPLVTLNYNVGAETLEFVEQDMPSYEPFPSTCQFGTYSYQLVYTASPTGPFPPFVNQYPAPKMIVGTQSTTYLGTNTFQIIVTESVSGLSNGDVTTDVFLYCETTGMTVSDEGFKVPFSYTPALSGNIDILLPPY